MTYILHLGDCLDPGSGLASLPDKSVDHVITDPPYEIEAHTKGRRILDPRRQTLRSAPIETFAQITEDQRSGLMLQVARVSRRWGLVFSQLEGVSRWIECARTAGLEYVRTMIWVKPNAQPQLTGDRPGVGYECIVVVHSDRSAGGRLRWNGGGKRGVVEVCTMANFSRQPRVHETQKPAELLELLVRDFTDPGETILDPFAGSGTTGVACNQLGRNFIGWERDANYHAIAMRRLNGDEAKPRPEQPSLFGAIR